MPESTRESPPVEEKEGKKAGLAWGRSWTVMQCQLRPWGSSKAEMILQTYPEWGWGCWAFKHLNPWVIRLRCSREGGMTWRVISLFILRQLITVSTIAPLGKNMWPPEWEQCLLVTDYQDIAFNGMNTDNLNNYHSTSVDYMPSAVLYNICHFI